MIAQRQGRRGSGLTRRIRAPLVGAALFGMCGCGGGDAARPTLSLPTPRAESDSRGNGELSNRRDSDCARAYSPELRFYRPRDESRESNWPPELRAVVSDARASLDAGHARLSSKPMRELRAIKPPTPLAEAEIATILAAALQIQDGPTSEVEGLIDTAAAGFERAKTRDRFADVSSWSALNRLPRSGALFQPPRPSEAAEALRLLAKASRAYREADPPVLQDALLCEALQAWLLLQLGEPLLADAFAQRVLAAASADDSLRSIAMLDWFASQFAIERGDWNDAAKRLANVWAQTREQVHAAEWRDVGLQLAEILARAGRWPDAFEVLRSEHPDDPRWTLRRWIVQRRCGPSDSPNDAEPEQVAHIRGLRAIEAGDWATAEVELATAAESERRSGHDDLAREAELGRAEALERADRLDEAASEFERVLRELRGCVRDEGSASPLELEARLARRAAAGHCRVLIKQQLLFDALAAWRAGQGLVWSIKSGGNTLRAASIGLAADGRAESRAVQRMKLELLQRALRGEPAHALANDFLACRLKGLKLTSTQPMAPFGNSRVRPRQEDLQLEPGRAVLVFARIGGDTIAGCLVRPPARVDWRVLPIRLSSLRELVAAWYRGLGDGGRSAAADDGPSLDGWLALGAEPDLAFAEQPVNAKSQVLESRLYDVVIRPFESLLVETSRLTLAPDDVLGALPFEVIGPDHRLIDRVRVDYIPSAALLFGTKRASEDSVPQPPSMLVLVSDPRAGDTLTRAGRDCGMAVDWGAPPIEHLVRAGRQDRQPSILVVPAPETQRTERIPPVLQWPVHARFVVALKGEADRALPTPGSANLEFARDTLATGASAALLTLWNPPADSDAELWRKLCTELATGHSIHDALESARRALVQNPKWRNPAHWAGYVLYSVP